MPRKYATEKKIVVKYIAWNITLEGEGTG